MCMAFLHRSTIFTYKHLFTSICYRWFHGKIDRSKTEELLKDGKNGTYLIRECYFPGYFTLSLCYAGIIEHYRIIHRDDMFTIDEESHFSNLSTLVEVWAEYIIIVSLKRTISFTSHILESSRIVIHNTC